MEEEDGSKGEEEEVEEEELRTPTERKRGRVHAVIGLLGANLAKKAECRRRTAAAIEDVIRGGEVWRFGGLLEKLPRREEISMGASKPHRVARAREMVIGG